MAHCFCKKIHGYAPIYAEDKILHTFGLVGVNFQHSCKCASVYGMFCIRILKPEKVFSDLCWKPAFILMFLTSLWRTIYMYHVCESSSTICVLPRLPLPGWPSAGGSPLRMRAWKPSWFCVVSRLVIRFNVLFMFIHQWTHKIPFFSHSLNNKSSNTEIRIPGNTRLEYKHRGEIEGKKISSFYTLEVGGDTDDDILGGTRNENTRQHKQQKEP